MTTNSLAIQFLKSTDIWPLFVEFNSGQYQSVSSCELRTVAQSSLGLYSALASEYDQFLQEKYLDNILLEINGIDHQLFTSNKNPLLVAEAHNRLQSLLFGNRFVTADCETGIHALWFPPIPINSMELDSNKKKPLSRTLSASLIKNWGLWSTKYGSLTYRMVQDGRNSSMKGTFYLKNSLRLRE